MKLVVFPNDNGVSIIITEIGEYSINNEKMKFRPYHEFLFRKISEYIIKKTEKGNIIDLGAWIGDNSIPWAKMIKRCQIGSFSSREETGLTKSADDSRIVYAIDPSPENCEYISTLCILNDVDNIVIIQKPISDKEEIISTEGDLLHCSFNKNVDGKIKLLATSLDNLSEITNTSYIHLDVEGMEYDVLIGAEKLIKTFKPIIAYEVHLSEIQNVNKILALLKSWDYDIYIINEILPGCNIDCRNCLALPKIGSYLKKEPKYIIKDIEDYLNEGKYCVISHVRDGPMKSNYKTLTEAMSVFSMLNGGPFATVLLENSGVSPKILCSYGIDQYIKICISSHNTTYQNVFTLL
jgi:FkbM family methyltransferase